VTQRYFSGGASSQRGFPERRLAPRVVGDDGSEVPIGGSALVEVGAELRLPRLFEWRDTDFGAAIFADGGDVTERFRELDATSLHWATGAGLRVATPIGPLRIDVGYRLNRYGADDRYPIRPGDRFAYHLSLGQSF